MTQPDVHMLEETAAAYETRLVPALFGPMADAIVAGLKEPAGARVLDVGCGTGALTRRLRTALPEAAGVTGLDANPGMLALARERGDGIVWVQADAAALPFEDGSFDLVVSQFALMLFDDRGAAAGEMWRVLAPGGQLVVAVFDGLEANDGYRQIAEVYERHVGADVASALRFPFSMGDTAEMAALLKDLGGTTPKFDTATVTARFASAADLALADVRGWFPFAGLSVSDPDLKRIQADLGKTFRSSDGGVVFDVHAHVVRTRNA